MNIDKPESILVVVNAGLSAAFSFVLLYATVTLLGVADRGQFAFLQTLSLTLVNVMRLGLHQQVQVLASPTALLPTRRLVVTQSVYLATLTFFLVFGLEHLGATLDLMLLTAHEVVLPLYAASLLFYANCSFLVLLTANARVNLAQICVFYGSLFAMIFAFERAGTVDVENVLIAVTIANGIGSLLCLYALRLQPSLRLRLSDVPSQLRGGMKIFGWSNLKDLMYRIDLLILPALLDVKSYGQYTVIQNLALSSWRVIDPLLSYYNRILIFIGPEFKSDSKLKIFRKVKIVVFCLSVVLSVVLTVFISHLTSEKDANVVFLTFVFCVTAVWFFRWKKLSIEELALGRHAFMYKSITFFILGYLCLVPFVRNLSSALLLVSALMAALILWAWRVDARSS